MSTTQQDKPAAKPRQRSRKADQRGRKGEQPRREALESTALERPDQGIAEPAAVPATVLVQDVLVQDLAVQDVPALELTADATLADGTAEPEAEPNKVEPSIMVEPDMAAEAELPLSGEVQPPVRSTGKQVSGAIDPLAVAESWGNYARKSFQARKSFFDRLMTVRSFDEAIEAHSEFARLTCANFLVESCKLYALYGEWTRQFLRPLENASAAWTRSAH